MLSFITFSPYLLKAVYSFTEMLQMFSNQFLHPNHVVPASELLSALMEVCHPFVAKLFVETNAVLCQVLIFGIDEGDTGIQVENALSLQPLFEDFMQLATYAAPFHTAVNIDGSLNRPLIGIPRMEGTGVGVAYDTPILLCHNPGIFPLDGLNTSAEFLFRRHIVFKCYRRVLDIRGVNCL